jgi:hypothetical protein
VPYRKLRKRKGTMAGRASYPRGASLLSLSDSLPQAHNGTDAICNHVSRFMWVHVTEGKGTRTSAGPRGIYRTLLHRVLFTKRIQDRVPGRIATPLFQHETFCGVFYQWRNEILGAIDRGMQLPFCSRRLNHSEELLVHLFKNTSL